MKTWTSGDICVLIEMNVTDLEYLEIRRSWHVCKYVFNPACASTVISIV